ncbi:MAG: RagB/SusD family nutrient uptake outer membrane protein [Bacteroidales bacterium]
MKKKNILLYSALLSAALTSCDLQRLPYDRYTEEDIMADKVTAVDILLNGAYGQLRDWSDVMHRVGEYAGDNIMIRGTSTDAFYSFISYRHTPDNYRLNTFWNNSYKVISQTSGLMGMINPGEDAKLQQKLGEAYYLRGMTYFYLCRAYGRPYSQSPETNLGVPIVNGIPDDLDNMKLPDRTTVEKSYRQAINDLRTAEALMNEDRTAAYATKYAAQAMLSRIYMYMSGTWENPNTMYADSSIYYAKQVVESGKYKMLPRETFMKYNSYAPDAPSQTETIFAVKRVSSEYSGYDHYYGIGGMYSNIDGMGWGEMYASHKYLTLLNKNGRGKDARSAFISPQYSLDDKGNKTPAFRVVVPTYDKGNVVSGYKYIQASISEEGGSVYAIYKETIDDKETTFKSKLTIVSEEDQTYSFVYEIDNKEYTGERDYVMLLNRVYPMFYITKCSLQDGESQLHSPIISRLAEMYLNMAECYAKKGDYANALSELNVVRERSLPGFGYQSLDVTNAAERIGEERQLEMAFEADRSYDVYRNGGTLTRHYPGPHGSLDEYPASHPRVVQYIPQEQINAYNSIGSTLTQNPN